MNQDFLFKKWIVFSIIILFFSSGLELVSISATNIGYESYDLIIITPNDFLDELQPLVTHKEQHGITTKIVTLDDIYDSVYFPVVGRDDAEKIKYFIKSAKENWDTNYVMLVGGKEDMPVRFVENIFGRHYNFLFRTLSRNLKPFFYNAVAISGKIIK